MGNQYILRKNHASLGDLKDGQAAVFATASKIFYVDAAHPRSVDSNNVGTDPDLPLKTITAAYNLCTTDRGDVIFVKGGDYRYRETDTLTILKDGVRIIGAGWGVEWNNNGLAGGYVVKVEAKNVVIANMQISVNDSGSGIYVGDGGANKNASLCVVENCFIRGDWLTATGPGAGVLKGIEVDGASTLTIRDNHIWGWGTGIDVSDGSDRTSYGCHIYRNKIVACQDYGILWAGIGYPSIVEDNLIADFSSTVTMTYGISLSPTTGGITIAGNKIAAANPVYDSGDLNYWCGNFVRSTEAASETVSVATIAHDTAAGA